MLDVEFGKVTLQSVEGILGSPQVFADNFSLPRWILGYVRQFWNSRWRSMKHARDMKKNRGRRGYAARQSRTPAC